MSDSKTQQLEIKSILASPWIDGAFGLPFPPNKNSYTNKIKIKSITSDMLKESRQNMGRAQYPARP